MTDRMTLREWEATVGRTADITVLIEFATSLGMDDDDAIAYATFGNYDGLRREIITREQDAEYVRQHKADAARRHAR